MYHDLEIKLCCNYMFPFLNQNNAIQNSVLSVM